MAKIALYSPDSHQAFQRCGIGVAQFRVLLGETDALIDHGEGLAHDGVGVLLEIHQIGQCFGTLDRSVEPALLQLGAGIGGAFRADDLDGRQPLGFAIGSTPFRRLVREGGAAAHADGLAAEIGERLELVLAGKGRVELRAGFHVIDEVERIAPLWKIAHAAMDKVDATGLKRRDHLLEADIRPFDRGAELLGKRNAEIDVDTLKFVGRRIDIFHRRIVRLVGDDDLAGRLHPLGQAGGIGGGCGEACDRERCDVLVHVVPHFVLVVAGDFVCRRHAVPQL